MTNQNKTFNPAEYPEAIELFEKIKEISMHGRGGLYRGVPESVYKKNIVKYTDKDGHIIYTGPECRVPESITKEYGTLSKDIEGVVYFINPTKGNINMTDPVTGVSTSFMYEIDMEGNESCMFDSVPIGNTPVNSFWTGKKVDFSGLTKIIQEINPNSKII